MTDVSTEVPPPKPLEGGQSNPLTMLTEKLEKFTVLYLDVLQQGRASSLTQFEHADKMLVWEIGLMGAGVFYANTLLASTHSGLRLVALAPWILGILAALSARVIGVRQMESSATWYMKEVLAFRDQLLVSKNWVDTLGAVLDAAFRLWKDARVALQSGPFLWWLRLSLAAHVLAGTGILTVVSVSVLTNTPVLATVVAALAMVSALIIWLRIVGATMKTYTDAQEEATASFAALRKSLVRDSTKEQAS